MVSSYLDKKTLLYCVVPTPVTSLLVTDVSTTTISVNWTSPISKNGNYVTYYNISYSPFCSEFFSVKVALVFVSSPTFTTITITLRELLSGINYIVTVKAGNVLGESSPVMIFGETKPTSGKIYLLILF